jgi:hypothetical protein
MEQIMNADKRVQSEAARRQASDWQIRKNRENAVRSTGPKTEEGKMRSRENATKHGFRKIIVSPGETSPEIEAERERFVDALMPSNDEALVYADLAYQAKRRLMLIYDADDAGRADRMRNATIRMVEERSAEVKRAEEILVDDPYLATAMLASTQRGCERVLEILADLEERLERNDWDETAARLLRSCSGRRANITRSRFDVDPAMIQAAREEVERLRELYCEQFDENEDEEAETLRLRIQMAKVDLTQSGRLMHRYQRDGMRDLLKMITNVRLCNEGKSPKRDSSPRVMPRPSTAFASAVAAMKPADVAPTKPAEPPKRPAPSHRGGSEVFFDLESLLTSTLGPLRAPNEPKSNPAGRSERINFSVGPVPPPVARPNTAPAPDGPKDRK